MKNKVEATIQIDENKKLKIVGILDELHYDASYPTISLDLRDVKIIEKVVKSDE